MEINPSHDAIDIVRRLQDAGFDAVLAGGCVRDALLGKTPHDWDIATSATPDQVSGIFPKCFSVGRAFGTTVIPGSDGENYEVTTFRGEGKYSDGRHPDEIRFVGMREDVMRRDFTVNALLYDPMAHRLLDFVDGQKDLKARILRTVGDPARRFEEDRLRVMRAVRFAAVLGFHVEEETWRAVCAMAPQVTPCVSSERIRDEIEKMLLCGVSARGLILMEQSGLLDAILPEVAAGRGVAQPPQYHPEGDVWQHELKLMGFLDEAFTRIRFCGETPAANERFDSEGRLAAATHAEWRWLCWGALLHDIGKPLTYVEGEDRIHFNGHDVQGATLAEVVMQRLKLPSEVVTNAKALVRQHMEITQITKARLSKQRRRFQDPLYPLLIELLRLDTSASFGILDLHRQVVGLWKEEQARPHPPKPSINGRDLIERGFKPNADLGAFLAFCADYELEHPFANRTEALDWLDNALRAKKEEKSREEGEGKRK